MTAYEPQDATFAEALRQRIDGKTKPLGALGRIEALAARIARVQGTLTPRAETCGLTIFAADHGIAAEGVSAYPQAVTRQMVLNFLDGNAAANVFARSVGASLRVVDAGVAGDPIIDSRLLSRRLGPGTRNARREAAMTAAERDRAIDGRAGARKRRSVRRGLLRRDGHRQHLRRQPRRPQGRRRCRWSGWSAAAPGSTTRRSTARRPSSPTRRHGRRRGSMRMWRWPSTAASRSR